MVAPDDLAASVPQFLGDAVVLPNTLGLHVAVEGEHPEHIVDQIEKALPKDEGRDCGAILPRSAKARMRILASEIADRLTVSFSGAANIGSMINHQHEN